MSAGTTTEARQERTAGERLWTRNSAWLAESHPSLLRILEKGDEGRFCRPVRQKGRIVNLETGGTRLYEPNAPALAKREVATYFAEKNFFLAAKQGMAVTTTHEARKRLDWMLARDLASVFLKDERKHKKSRKSRGMPTRERSLLLVFGLGLGYHIAPLLQRLKPCNVCILETRKEHVFFAGCSHDFARWDALCKQRNGGLRLVVADDAEDLEKALTDFLANDLHFFAENFLFYRHTTTAATLRRLGSRLSDILQTSLINKGFFEDQILMLENGTRNLCLGAPSVLLKPNMRTRQKEEALILANGPSLDDALPYLKRLCVGRVVFSCGSTLYTLMKNGIEPHYHCEIENIFPETHHVAQLQQEGYALDGMTLLAAVTVQPNVVASFPRRVLFMRPFVPIGYLSDFETLDYATPTVANTALACAQTMGFSTLLLLGVDCGYKQGRLHHAKDAVHFLDEERKKEEERRQKKSHLVFRGNFGGYVHSQEILLATKQRLELEARRYALNRHYNCSDGAFLQGFVPRLPSLIEPLDSASTHDTSLWHDLCPRLSFADEGLLERVQRAQDYLAVCAQRLESMFAVVEEVESIADLQALHNGLKDFFEREDRQHRLLAHSFVLSFYTGSAFIFFSLIHKCYLECSKQRWKRLRRDLSAHVQKRLRAMKPRLEEALAATHAAVAKEIDKKSANDQE